MSDNPYTDDEYDSTYKDVHGDEEAREKYTGDEMGDSFFPSSVGGSLSPSGWGIWPAGDAADATAEEDRAETGADYDTANETGADDSDGSWWDVGLIGTLLVVGVALFLFPEPATSAIGIGLIALGVVAWVVDWLM
ncbi:hypothetical protein [Halorussus lipolyticus]|uniref:hypothetical protein n=1 Tax=Halorussus lipolyticus TaxID=3034024 RepID=UPI0023E8C01B|nr:hypothetical protein [Halorussus sp. DT80]